MRSLVRYVKNGCDVYDSITDVDSIKGESFNTLRTYFELLISAFDKGLYNFNFTFIYNVCLYLPFGNL